MLTPEERAEIEQKVARLTARMVALDHLNKPENIREWAALYAEREALDDQLTLPNDSRN